MKRIYIKLLFRFSKYIYGNVLGKRYIHARHSVCLPMVIVPIQIGFLFLFVEIKKMWIKEVFASFLLLTNTIFFFKSLFALLFTHNKNFNENILYMNCALFVCFLCFKIFFFLLLYNFEITFVHLLCTICKLDVHFW